MTVEVIGTFADRFDDEVRVEIEKGIVVLVVSESPKACAAELDGSTAAAIGRALIEAARRVG